MNQPGQPEPDWMEKLYGLGQGFKHGVEKYTHGILSPVLESGILGEALKKGFGPYREEQLAQFEHAQQRTPGYAAAGNVLGTIGANLPLATAFGPASTVGGNAAVGAATGGLSGFARMPEEGETRSKNALIDSLLGGALSGALSAVGKGYGALKNVNPNRAVKNILATEEQALKPSRELYQDLEQVLKESGKASNLQIPKNIDWKAIENKVEYKKIKEIKDLLEEGTYSSFNKAQSEINKEYSKLLSQGKAGGNVTKALNALDNAEKRIHGKLFERFNEVSPELANQYQRANELYAKEIGPFDVPQLKEYKELLRNYGKVDKKTAKETVDALLKSKDFRNALPEEASTLERSLATMKFLDELKAKAPWVLGGALGGSVLLGKRNK